MSWRLETYGDSGMIHDLFRGIPGSPCSGEGRGGEGAGADGHGPLPECRVERWRGGVGRAHRLSGLSAAGASSPDSARFHLPLIEPDLRIARIRLSREDLTPSHSNSPVAERSFQTRHSQRRTGPPVVAVPLVPPNLVLATQPPAEPHRPHQLGVWNAVEIPAQVRVDHLRMPRSQ